MKYISIPPDDPTVDLSLAITTVFGHTMSDLEHQYTITSGNNLV